jgi:two-component system LytT family response regulator
MRILIVDDEAPARARLRRLLAGEDDAVVAGEADTGDVAVESIAELQPDLVLLDVQMPGLDGFGVVAAVGAAEMPPVIFVTAHDEHAVRAFEVHAVDYLLKPVSAERLGAALQRARARMAATAPESAAPAQPPLEALLRALNPAPAYLRRVLVHDDRRALFIPVSSIDRVEAESNYVRVHVQGGSYRLRGTLGAFAERLDPAHFLQLSRSTLVRLDAVKELHPWSHGDYQVVLHDGTTLMWSRRYRAQRGAEFAG